jgi:hypothetical protein
MVPQDHAALTLLSGYNKGLRRILRMCRRRREFRAEPFGLGRRLLLAIAPASLPSHIQIHIHPNVGFEGTTIPGTTELSQVVTQQDREATVSLSGYVQPGMGTLQVAVATDPSSSAVGVNVGAADQTVTFANGESQAGLIGGPGGAGRAAPREELRPAGLAIWRSSERLDFATSATSARSAGRGWRLA